MASNASIRAWLGALLLGVLLPALAQTDLPERMQSAERELVRIAQGERPEVFGARYRLGVYMPAGSRLSDVWSDVLAKSFLLRADGPMTDRRILPGEWMHNLLPPLSEAQWDALSRGVAQMREGDTLRIDYIPASGTVIRVDGQPLLGVGGHEVFLGFARTWLGATPVSDLLKQDLLESAAEAER